MFKNRVPHPSSLSAPEPLGVRVRRRRVLTQMNIV
jgi:hypothetical protein